MPTAPTTVQNKNFNPEGQLPALDAVANAHINELNTVLLGKIPNAEKGVANGVATLGGDGKVPGSQLPAEAGLGNVTGAASSEDGEYALMDGVTGKVLKGGGTPITTPAWPAAGDMVIFEEYNNGRKLASGGNVQAQMALMFTPLIAAAGGGTSELNIACIGTNAATAHQITADYNTLAQAGGNGLSGVTLPVATGAGEVVYINCVLLANLAKVYANGSDLVDGVASTFIGNGINIVRAFQSNSAGNWTLIISL